MAAELGFLWDFSDFVVNAIPWINIILVCAAAYFGWKTVFGVEPKASKAWGMSGTKLPPGIASKVKGVIPWTAENQAINKIRADAKKENTALLREWLDEKKELEDIQKAEKAFKVFATETEELKTADVKKSDFKAAYDTLVSETADAKRLIRRLTRNTFRQERRYKLLIEDLHGKGVDIKMLEIAEDNLLAEHKRMSDALATTMNLIEKGGSVGKNAVGLIKLKGSVLKPTTAAGSKTVADVATTMVTELGGVKANIDRALTAQTDAYKFCTGIVAEIKKLADKLP